MAEFKYLAIKNWDVYQKRMGKRDFIKDSTNKDGDPEYSKLSAFCRYLLDGLQRLRGRFGKNPQNDATWIAQALLMVRTDRPHVQHAIDTLIAHGFLIPTNQQDDSIEKIREEEKRPEENKQSAAPPPDPKPVPKLAVVTPKSTFELPVWVNQKTWEDFELMRNKMRKPLTNRARELIVRDLERLMNKGHPPQEVLEQSIANGWLGVFPLKGERNGGANQPSKAQQREQRNRQVIEALTRGIYGDRGVGEGDPRAQAAGAARPDGNEAHMGGPIEYLPPQGD